MDCVDIYFGMHIAWDSRHHHHLPYDTLINKAEMFKQNICRGIFPYKTPIVAHYYSIIIIIITCAHPNNQMNAHSIHKRITNSKWMKRANEASKRATPIFNQLHKSSPCVWQIEQPTVDFYHFQLNQKFPAESETHGILKQSSWNVLLNVCAFGQHWTTSRFWVCWCYLCFNLNAPNARQ